MLHRILILLCCLVIAEANSVTFDQFLLSSETSTGGGDEGLGLLERLPRRKRQLKGKGDSSTLSTCAITGGLMKALDFLKTLEVNPRMMDQFSEQQLVSRLGEIARVTRESNPDIDYPEGFFLKLLTIWIGNQASPGDVCDLAPDSVVAKFNLVINQGDECDAKLHTSVMTSLRVVLFWAGCPSNALTRVAKFLAQKYLEDNGAMVAAKKVVASNVDDATKVVLIVADVVQELGAGLCMEVIAEAIESAYPKQLGVVTYFKAIQTILRAAGVFADKDAFLDWGKSTSISFGTVFDEYIGSCV